MILIQAASAGLWQLPL